MKASFYFLISFIFCNFAYATGGTVGNGGFVITCANRTNYLSLDYVLAEQNFSRNVRVKTSADLRTSLFRIHSIIEKNMPELANSFLEFIQDIGNTTDTSKLHIWDSYNFGLPDETDDQNIESIPFSCESIRRAGGQLKQVIIRYELEKSNGQKQILFKYDKSILPFIPATQASFVYVHEWLWSQSKNVQQNRNANYFLHSNLAEQLSPADFVSQMNKFGIGLGSVK